MIIITEQLNSNTKIKTQAIKEGINCACDTKLCNEKIEYLEGYSNAIFEIESFDGFYNHYHSDTDNNLQQQK